MAYTTKAAEYLCGGGARNDQIDYFFDFCSTFKMVGKKACYEIYRLWARLLRHGQTPYKNHGRFDFQSDLKWYLQGETKGVIDDDPPSDTIYDDDDPPSDAISDDDLSSDTIYVDDSPSDAICVDSGI